MTQTEALRLALEALYNLSHYADTCELFLKETHPGKADALRQRVIKSIEAITAIKAALEAKDGCQCPACKTAPHASDCAVHNEPAYPAGECNCGAKGEPVAWVCPEFWQHLENLNCGTAYRLSGIGRQPLYSAPQKQPPVIDKSVARRIATQLGWEPPRTPITDEDIRQANHHMVCGAYDYSFKQGVRWAEKVHGIKWEWEK